MWPRRVTTPAVALSGAVAPAARAPIPARVMIAPSHSCCRAFSSASPNDHAAPYCSSSPTFSLAFPSAHSCRCFASAVATSGGGAAGAVCTSRTPRRMLSAAHLLSPVLVPRRAFSQSNKGQSLPFQDGQADPRYTGPDYPHSSNNTGGAAAAGNTSPPQRRLNPATMPHYVKATIQNDRREMGLSEVISWEDFAAEAIYIPTRSGPLWVGADDPRAAKFVRRRDKMKKNPMQLGKKKAAPKGSQDPAKALESHPLREFFTTPTNLNDPLSVANNLYRAGYLHQTAPGALVNDGIGGGGGGGGGAARPGVSGEANIKFVASKIEYRKRRPIVSVMGHVDHGKTTLLDYLRRSNVAAGEAGGITQNVGAFTVNIDRFMRAQETENAGEGADQSSNSNGSNGNSNGAKASGGAAAAAGTKGSGKESAPPSEDHLITFIDTPGHAAFTAMRAVGAAANDFIILVVSVTDGVQPQTREVVELARQHGTPLIVAITKMDRLHLSQAGAAAAAQSAAASGGSNGNHNNGGPATDATGGIRHGGAGSVAGIKRALTEDCGLELEEDGGDVQVLPICARDGTGVGELLEAVLLQAEMCEIATPHPARAELVILESAQNRKSPTEALRDKDDRVVDRRGGRHRQEIAAVVRCGTVRPGQVLVAGMTYARVSRLFDENGAEIGEAGPGTPVLMLGFKVHPKPGSILMQVSSEAHAEKYYFFMKEVYETEGGRENYLQLLSSESQGQFFKRKPDNNNVRAYNDVPFGLICKAATFGMLQALMKTIYELPRLPGVALEVKNTEVGSVSNIDVMLVGGGGQPGAILEFGEIADNSAEATVLDVPSHIARLKFNVLYHGIEELKALMVAQLPKIRRTRVVARAEVLQLFKASQAGRGGNAAGVMVVKGPLEAGSPVVRVKRPKNRSATSSINSNNNSNNSNGSSAGKSKDYDDESQYEIVYEGGIKELRRFKDLVPAVEGGLECGVILHDAFAFRVGDVLEAVEHYEEERDVVAEFEAAEQRERALLRDAEIQAELMEASSSGDSAQAGKGGAVGDDGKSKAGERAKVSASA